VKQLFSVFLCSRAAPLERNSLTHRHMVSLIASEMWNTLGNKRRFSIHPRTSNAPSSPALLEPMPRFPARTLPPFDFAGVPVTANPIPAFASIRRRQEVTLWSSKSALPLKSGVTNLFPDGEVWRAINSSRHSARSGDRRTTVGGKTMKSQGCSENTLCSGSRCVVLPRLSDIHPG
jgi:hypothetical protein